ncbi:TetR family transcriptional regulator [Streptomyces sp. NPDC059816]|uniref:TetR family transcriptional regulator n=1 Tax=Streptomyces sp. NPDC059816 TaxID=3346960 RepID=UPI003647C773
MSADNDRPTKQPSVAPVPGGDGGTPHAEKDPAKSEKSAERTAKSEQTRALILQTALRLFEERGYDKTTMRAIAKEAGVSVGNAYYYFDGKEHLVQGVYDRISAEHKAAIQPILARETDLHARLAGVLTAWVDIAEPYHEFAAQFFKNAADPQSPLSPFSPESRAARDAAIETHRQVLAGSKTKVPEDLADALPELLWLSQMGLVLYWVFDRSEGRERSRRLAARGSRLTARTVGLARFRLLRPLVREVHELFTDFGPPFDEPAAGKGPKPTSGA